MSVDESELDARFYEMVEAVISIAESLKTIAEHLEKKG